MLAGTDMEHLDVQPHTQTKNTQGFTDIHCSNISTEAACTQTHTFVRKLRCCVLCITWSLLEIPHQAGSCFAFHCSTHCLYQPPWLSSLHTHYIIQYKHLSLSVSVTFMQSLTLYCWYGLSCTHTHPSPADCISNDFVNNIHVVSLSLSLSLLYWKCEHLHGFIFVWGCTHKTLK